MNFVGGVSRPSSAPPPGRRRPTGSLELPNRQRQYDG